MRGEADTIFALSSGRLPSGVAVVRLSGPHALEALAACSGTVPPARVARYGVVRDPFTGEVLDRALMLAFRAPASATGEDSAEFHLHGGRAVVARMLDLLSRLPGLRLAQAGEFTRRAHENGKIDLAEAEGLADLIAAETEGQRRQALAQASGLLSRAVEAWRDRLVRALALVEALVDFSDEGDVPEDVISPALAEVEALRNQLVTVLADSVRGELVREGLVVAIAGPPNAGKSTLLNRLAGREAAIVSAVPGTTRDLLEVHLDLAGQAVTLVDTAGIRDTDDEVEAEGVRRARARAGIADLVLWLTIDGAAPPQDLSGAVRVRTKSDLGHGGRGDVSISAATGAGLEDLVDLISRRAAALTGGEPALVVRTRQKRELEEAVSHLSRFCATARAGVSEEILAEDLRLAARALDKVVGRIDVEHVLDALFRTFCIGK